MKYFSVVVVCLLLLKYPEKEIMAMMDYHIKPSYKAIFTTKTFCIGPLILSSHYHGGYEWYITKTLDQRVHDYKASFKC